MASTILLQYDGADWNPVTTMPNSGMTSAPAFATFPDANGNPLLYCAYRIGNGAIRYTTYDGIQWLAQDLPMSNAASSRAPALAANKGKLYCLYQDPGNDGTLHYVVFDGQNWSPDAPVKSAPGTPSIPGMSESPALAVYTDPANQANSLLYCLYQSYRKGGWLQCVTFDGTKWITQSLPSLGMSNSPTAAVFQGRLYCLYQDRGRKGDLTGAVFNAASNTWSALNEGQPLSIPGLTGAIITGSPAASVQIGTSEIVTETGGTPQTNPTLFCLFQGGGNNGQLNCISTQDGATWELNMSLNVQMPAETSPSVTTYDDYLYCVYQGVAIPATTEIPLALGQQDVYQNVRSDHLGPAIQQALQGGAATAAFFQQSYLASSFFSWLNTQGDAAWIKVFDEVANQFYLVAVQEGQTASDTISMVISGLPVPGYFNQQSATAAASTVASAPRTPALEQILAAVRDNRPHGQRASPAANVRDGIGTGTSAGSFTFNGKTYNIVGTITTSFVVNGQVAWYIHVPLGAVNLVLPSLAKIAWTNLVWPILLSMTRGLLVFVKTLLVEGAAAIGEGMVATTLYDAGQAVGLGAAEVAGLEEGVVLGISTGGLALAGLAVIAGITLFVEYFLLHNTSHVVKVYNLSPYDISWSIPYLPEGAISMSPAIAAGSSSVNYIIPANHSLQVGNGSVTVYREADFSLISGSSTHGIQYVMAFTVMDPNNNDAIIGTASAVFDMPFKGDNSLYTTVTADTAAPSAAYCKSLYGQFSGTYKQVSYQSVGKLANGAQLQVTATYDLLSGTQPPPNNPGGTKEYLYNSIIVLQTV